MATDPEPNLMSDAIGGRPRTLGDVPEDIARRYYTDGRGGGLNFYVDATTRQPAFRDRGDRLTSARNDPNAIRHMLAVAKHRDWTVVLVRGTPEFRREAWMAGRAAGLDVRGYRPTERDIQALQRRLAAARRREAPEAPEQVGLARRPSDARTSAPQNSSAQFKTLEAVVRARVPNPIEQDRILASARERLARWFERGATFDLARRPERAPSRTVEGRER
jgi:hypothetical protein